MGEIVNLRRVKKAKAREAAAQAAHENRIRHGRTAGQKAEDERARTQAAQATEAARLDRDPETKTTGD
jgi:hypothetical protein